MARSVTIRVTRAPQLKILGPFTQDISKLRVFQGMNPVSLTNSMHTVKVLAIGSCNHQLNAVLSVLWWFPCLEKLYVIFFRLYEMNKENEPQYDPLQPIECLQNHLKTVVLKFYSGYEQQVAFARFFVLNAKVLNKIEFEVVHGDSKVQSVACPHRLLQVENRASRDIQSELRGNCYCDDYHVNMHIHDLSTVDPFRQGTSLKICRPQCLLYF